MANKFQWWKDADGTYAVEIAPDGSVVRVVGLMGAEDYLDEHEGDYVNRAKYWNAHPDERAAVEVIADDATIPEIT